MAEDNLVLFLL